MTRQHLSLLDLLILRYYLRDPSAYPTFYSIIYRYLLVLREGKFIRCNYTYNIIAATLQDYIRTDIMIRLMLIDDDDGTIERRLCE